MVTELLAQRRQSCHLDGEQLKGGKQARLSGILARFRREGAAAEPVAFGSHRKPEAILLSYEVYERYEALARQRTRLDHALSAAQSVQVEVPGPFSPER